MASALSVQTRNRAGPARSGRTGRPTARDAFESRPCRRRARSRIRTLRIEREAGRCDISHNLDDGLGLALHASFFDPKLLWRSEERGTVDCRAHMARNRLSKRVAQFFSACFPEETNSSLRSDIASRRPRHSAD